MAFLGLAGVALDRAFQANAKVSVKNQLKTQISALLTVLEIDSEGNLSIPERMPENRLTSPNSGLYAVILDEQGRIIWRSRSSIGIPLDYLQVAQLGRESFYQIGDNLENPFYYSFEITWEVGLAKEVALTWRLRNWMLRYKKYMPIKISIVSGVLSLIQYFMVMRVICLSSWET